MHFKERKKNEIVKKFTLKVDEKRMIIEKAGPVYGLLVLGG